MIELLEARLIKLPHVGVGSVTLKPRYERAYSNKTEAANVSVPLTITKVNTLGIRCLVI